MAKPGKLVKLNKKSDNDIAALALLPVAAALLALVFKLNFLVTTILFFGSPALYLSYREPSKIKRNLIFAGCFTIAGIYTDYMAERDLSWAEPSSVFNFRIGGLEPIESVVWFFLITYLVLAFYEHFFDKSSHKAVGKRMKLMFLILIFATISFLLMLLAYHNSFSIQYFYLKLGIIFGLLPLSAFIFEFPKFLSIFLKTAPYFLAISLLDEFVGLHNHHWIFPGTHFVGWVQLGTYRFPFEELIFWMIMFSSIVIAYFEIFDDDRLKFKLLRR